VLDDYRALIGNQSRKLMTSSALIMPTAMPEQSFCLPQKIENLKNGTTKENAENCWNIPQKVSVANLIQANLMHRLECSEHRADSETTDQWASSPSSSSWLAGERAGMCWRCSRAAVRAMMLCMSSDRHRRDDSSLAQYSIAVMPTHTYLQIISTGDIQP